MGRNLDEPSFVRKITSVSHQEGGNLDSANRRLKRKRIKPLAYSDVPIITPYPILSSPRPDRALQDPKAAENSSAENGPSMGSVSSTPRSIGTETGTMPGLTSSPLRVRIAGESGSEHRSVRLPTAREESDLTIFHILERPTEGSIDSQKATKERCFCHLRNFLTSPSTLLHTTLPSLV